MPLRPETTAPLPVIYGKDYVEPEDVPLNQVFYEADTQQFKFWTGTAWQEIPAAPNYNAYYWDDLTGPVASLNPTGPDGAMSVSAVDGLLEAPNTGNASCFASFQLSHQYKEGTDVNLHLHCYKETGTPAAADALAIGWEYRHKWIAVGGAAPADDGWVADWTAMTEVTGAPCNAIRKSGIYSVQLSGTGHVISDRLIVAIRRNVADAYNGVVRLEFVDLHYQKDATGSAAEYTK